MYMCTRLMARLPAGSSLVTLRLNTCMSGGVIDRSKGRVWSRQHRGKAAALQLASLQSAASAARHDHPRHMLAVA